MAKERRYMYYVYFAYAALFITTLILFMMPSMPGFESITGSSIYLAPVYQQQTWKLLALPFTLAVLLFLIVEGFRKP